LTTELAVGNRAARLPQEERELLAGRLGRSHGLDDAPVPWVWILTGTFAVPVGWKRLLRSAPRWLTEAVIALHAAGLTAMGWVSLSSIASSLPAEVFQPPFSDRGTRTRAQRARSGDLHDTASAAEVFWAQLARAVDFTSSEARPWTHSRTRDLLTDSESEPGL
jgi:hypothetical protein